MKDIVNLIIDRVFSFPIFAFVVAFLLIFLVIKVGEKERQEAASLQAQVAACYNLGMVRVDSDAGPRCALPANLPAIK